MKKIDGGQRRLIADYLANIGVAWFAAGVIGIFIGGTRNVIDVAVSLVWGLTFSTLFLLAGTYLVKGVKI